MDIKNEILRRIYMVLFVLIVLSIIIFIKTAHIQGFEGERWLAKSDSMHIDLRAIPAVRGNIIGADGSLLATSLPYYEIRMDFNPGNLTDDKFNKNIDSLAACLMPYVQNRYPTKADFVSVLRDARNRKYRYFPICRDISYGDLQKIRTFPLFNLNNSYESGLIVQKQNKRNTPFKMLAHRTIGYVRDNAQPVGLESAFNDELQGKKGKQLMQRVTGGHWIPLFDITSIEPKRGKDVKTTISPNIQNVASRALLKAIQKHNAEHGCAVVMEVKTGAIRAIANIGKIRNGGYWEDYNYAVGTSTEPGSTFKLPIIMALLEDGHIGLNDSLQLHKGKHMFYEEEMEDASLHNLDSTSVKRAFEVSSNVGIAKLTDKYYNQTGQETALIERLKQFHLHEQVEIEIEGEGKPLIKSPQRKDWSKTTIPWMSIGYELLVTPLQLLTFYNAVANNGKMMKPYLVSEISNYGKTLKTFEPIVLDEQIAKPQTIRLAKTLLQAVVENGTARGIKTEQFAIAGKTGTAQMNYSKFRKTKIKYQASFAGFFPADKPVYSCIVVIRDPKSGSFYGSDVAAPVFKAIAERCYVKQIDNHDTLNKHKTRPIIAQRKLPDFVVGYKSDIHTILDYTDIPYTGQSKTDWTVARADSVHLDLQTRSGPMKKTVPNVAGMGLRDAIYLLEKQGFEPVIVDDTFGKVQKQSVPGGRLAVVGTRIFLRLR